MKVGAADVLLKLNYLRSRHIAEKIFLTPSIIKYFIERSSVT